MPVLKTIADLLIFITEKYVVDIMVNVVTAFSIMFSILYTEAFTIYTYVSGKM